MIPLNRAARPVVEEVVNVSPFVNVTEVYNVTLPRAQPVEATPIGRPTKSVAV